MNIPTCHRCPERHRNGTRCEVLQEKLDAVKGAGLTSIRFKCEKRIALPCKVSPGDVVEFEIYGSRYQEELFCCGIVMRVALAGEKVLVYADKRENFDMPKRQVLYLDPERLDTTGKRHPVCIHCGCPRGKTPKIRSRHDNEERDWMCTMSVCDFGDDGAEAVTEEVVMAGKGDSIW